MANDKCLRAFYKPLAWFPVVFINAIIVWSYFAYVVILCFDTVRSTTERVVYLAIFHPIFIIFMAAYWKTILSSAGNVPQQFYLSKQDRDKYDRAENPQEFINELARNLPITTWSVNGGARFCEPCQLIKPDRAHHCSMCNGCILKMDHHCPWVNNCVGYGNYKYFLLFLFYAIVYTFFVAVTVFQYFLKFWGHSAVKPDSSLHVLFLFFISAMFFVSLWSLFGYHLYLIFSNRSTLESFRAPIFTNGPDKNGFSMGKKNNFKQVFGSRTILWFFPIFSSLGNGYNYPLGKSHAPESESLLNGTMSNDRILHIAGERDELLPEEPTSPFYSGVPASLSGQFSASDSESELNTVALRSTDHVAVNFVDDVDDDDLCSQKHFGSL